MLTVRFDSPVSLTEQIRLGIREAIATGALQPGHDLPPVRQLAHDLGINFNTVARAYRDLEQDGLIATVRGRGTVVTSKQEMQRGADGEVEQRLRANLRNFLADARLAGLMRGRVQRLFLQELGEFWDPRVGKS